jgi:glutamine synthetase
LVSGFEAPVYIAYSDHNRSALIRIPASRGLGTRLELRMVDPSCNPYLAMALVLAAGLEGIHEQRDPGEPTRRDIFQMSAIEREEAHIVSIPSDLKEAIEVFSKSQFSEKIIGKHLFDKFILSRHLELQDYRQEVHQWEIKRYINRF